MMDEIKPAPTEAQNRRAWCAKMLAYLKWKRSRIDPGVVELPDCDFLNVAPRRTLRILRPELKSERFYEAQAPANRPESINDNFYSRWARRPHPSGNCRCSFRQSVNSNRLSSHEEKIISQEIQRIRSSLCEAEKSGKDIEEVERSLSVNLTQLQATVNDKEEAGQKNLTNDESQTKEGQPNEKTKIEPLEEHVKRKIVRDLDRYISDLLDEILNDTIRAIARADNPFDREREKEPDGSSTQPATFDISFAFHSSDEDKKTTGVQSKDNVETNLKEEEKGYVNQGFVGTASDPDAVEFHLRGRLNGDVVLENVDCIDSGINSVETIELQPEQDQNLEQSLIDIIDAKLGGASIGKSLEDLGMEIDATDEAKSAKMKESGDAGVSSKIIPEARQTTATAAATVEVEVKKSTSPNKEVAIREAPVNLPAERTSKSLDEVIEEPTFNSLRLEFKRRSNASITSKESDEKQASNVSARVNKTMTTIRRRIATRLANSRRKPNNNNISDGSSKSSKSSAGSGTASKTRASLELEDYRRRFPIPETVRQRHSRAKSEDEIHALEDSEVTLRNRNRKPMIIFLHGFGSSAESFEPQLRYFANLGYPCIAPDLLGHGMSSAPNRRGDYHFDKLLKDLETVLLHYAFKPGQKCVLVGHNYGCSFANALASKYMNNVHQLVLISGGGPTPLAPPLSEGPFHCCLRASLAPFLLCGMNRAVLYSARGRQHPYCGSELHEDQWPSHMRHVLRGMSWPEGDYVFHRRMCTPTLLVHGLRDKKVSLVQECQMERTMVKAFLEAIPTAGHMPMTDCPEQLNHMIHCFIDLWKNKKW